MKTGPKKKGSLHRTVMIGKEKKRSLTLNNNLTSLLCKKHLSCKSFQKSFYAKVRRKKKKSVKIQQEDLVTKHSAVLGLCAFVNAFPYDVPEFVPDILMVLSDHLHDPQPIPVSCYIR